jgi:hypothetical protein
MLRRLLAVGQLEVVGELLLAHPAYADSDAGGLQVRPSMPGSYASRQNK